jgi:hypothetical protein
MYKSRFILVLGLLSLLLVGMAVRQSQLLVSSLPGQTASDFYQRHPDWTWVVEDQNASTPITGDSAFPDYFQRHPELRRSVNRSIDTTDYFFRHLAKDASPLVVPISADQSRREYLLGERYGEIPQNTVLFGVEQIRREYMLGERYGQTPIVQFTDAVNECFYVPVSEIACRNQNQAP